MGGTHVPPVDSLRSRLRGRSDAWRDAQHWKQRSIAAGSPSACATPLATASPQRQLAVRQREERVHVSLDDEVRVLHGADARELRAVKTSSSIFSRYISVRPRLLPVE
jgi:hypothetical protein